MAVESGMSCVDAAEIQFVAEKEKGRGQRIRQGETVVCGPVADG